MVKNFCEIEEQFEFLKHMHHTRESLRLEKKNMLRTFLGLKLKKLRTSEGFLQFGSSYKKTCIYPHIKEVISRN